MGETGKGTKKSVSSSNPLDWKIFSRGGTAKRGFPVLETTIHFIQREDRVMRRKLIFLTCILFLVMVGCAPTTHFGVPDKALTAPAEFGQTEAAIASAERSDGAKYCPEKIARAKELGRKAAEIYWACHTEEAMALLAEARNLAKEAESCQPPAMVTPPPPPPPPRVTPPSSPPPPPARQPVSFHSGYFEFDKSDLTPEMKAELDRAAKIMQDDPDVMLELQGNTDSVGTDAYNKKLGERRAEAVFDYLKSKGIDPDRLKKVSFGESKPVASNATDAGRAQNRRVDIVIVK
jgi:outer membrane protein OmpA-like peptidoglycan-associated protein